MEAAVKQALKMLQPMRERRLEDPEAARQRRAAVARKWCVGGDIGGFDTFHAIMEDLFATADYNGDGKASRRELRKCFKRHPEHCEAVCMWLFMCALGLPAGLPAERDERLHTVLIERFDANGDGWLEQEELLRAMVRPWPPPPHAPSLPLFVP